MDQIGPYPIIKELARGGMGVVYHARDPILERDVAVKVLLAAGSGEDDLARFRREAQVTARLRHPNIVGIHSLGVVRGHAYLVIDLIHGESLHDRIQRDGPLPEREAARLIRVLSQAVDYAHSQGVLHRDLKPRNVVIGDDGRPVLVDFGLAKILGLGKDLSRTGEVLGTPAFMSPEQARWDTDAIGPRSDVYGLGATLFAALSGRPPFQAASVIATLASVVEDPVPSVTGLRPEVDSTLSALCSRCLQKDPDARFASAGAFAQALEEWEQARGSEAPARAPLAVGMLVVGVLLGVGLAQIGRSPASDPVREPPQASAVPDPADPNGGPDGPDPAGGTEARMAEARGHYERGDLEGALRIYRRVAKLEPENALSRFGEGTCLFKLGRLEEAERAFSRGLEGDAGADAWTGLLNRGILRRQRGDRRGALADFDALLEQKPDLPQGYTLRSRERGRLGDPEGALADLERAVKLAPRDMGYQYDLGVLLLRTRRFSDARDRFDRVIEAEPGNAKAWGNRAAAKTHLGDSEGGALDATRAIQLTPEHHQPWSNRGRAYLSLGRMALALRDLSRALELEPHADTYFYRAETHIRMGNDALALADCDRAIELEPKHYKALMQRGYMRQGQSDLPGAVRDFTTALAAYPDAAEPLMFRGRVRALLSDPAGAALDFDEAIRRSPKDYRGYALRAQLRRAQGQTDAALLDYEAALGLTKSEARRGEIKSAIDSLRSGQ